MEVVPPLVHKLVVCGIVSSNRLKCVTEQPKEELPMPIECIQGNTAM